jgi:hypothetical protein
MWQRDRGAAGETPVFGILKSKGKVFANSCSKEELMPNLPITNLSI